MEEGSLLPAALSSSRQQQQQQSVTDDDDGDQDDAGQEQQEQQHAQHAALVVDVFLLSRCGGLCLDDPQESTSAALLQDHLLQLAETAVAWNESLLLVEPSCHDPKNTNKHPYYPWIAGGDGPAFGVHVTAVVPPAAVQHHRHRRRQPSRPLPHLRAVCRYFGVGVEDEWELVGRLLQYTSSSQQQQQQRAEDWAVECWDVDDGQLLLIEAAEHLPDWVDQIGPERCRHRCWIRRGQVVLIRPEPDELEAVASRPPLSLLEALTLLRNNSPLVQVAPNAVQTAIQNRLAHHARRPYHHSAAVAVPRAVARLLRHRPDLVATACRLFVEQTRPHENKQPPLHDLGSVLSHNKNDDGNDWVWTTVRFGRTPYAMLRTVTCRRDWTSEEAIPASYAQFLAVKRLQRQCAVEATPHLRYGLALGVRLTAGIAYGCSANLTTTATPTTANPLSTETSHHHVPARLVHWMRLAAAAGVHDDWLIRAWHAGPQAAAHNLTNVLQCPVVDGELDSPFALTPLSHPEISLADQIRQGLRRRAGAVGDDDDYDDDDFGLVPPRADQVDNEDWMWMPCDDDEWLQSRSAVPLAEAKENPDIANRSSRPFHPPPVTETNDTDPTALRDMLTGVQSFLAGQSFVEGVATRDPNATKHAVLGGTTTTTTPTTTTIPVINPTVFLNLLHATLQSDTAEKLKIRLSHTAVDAQPGGQIDDPFFSQEDYDWMEPSLEDDNDSSVASDLAQEADTDTTDFMRAMDEELLQHENASRWLDGNDDDDDDNVRNGNDSAVAQDMHVLSNLLKSLDAGNGGPGPIKNILGEMGIRAPSLDSQQHHEKEQE